MCSSQFTLALREHAHARRHAQQIPRDPKGVRGAKPLDKACTDVKCKRGENEQDFTPFALIVFSAKQLDSSSKDLRKRRKEDRKD